MENVPLRWQASQRRLLTCAVALTALFVIVLPASAQAPSVPFNALPSRFLLCNSDQYATAAQLNLRQRVCWYGSALVSPWAAARATFSSGMGQWLNTPYLRNQDADDYAHRIAVYYVRRSARETGELIAGYLDHEDPRPHPSGQTTVKRRIGSALLSVLVTTGSQGKRPALGPIVGSLGSGFAGAAFDREHMDTAYALRGAGTTYASYFGKALFQEFRPDISLFVKRILHRAH
jgi:hypothetical protein